MPDLPPVNLKGLLWAATERVRAYHATKSLAPTYPDGEEGRSALSRDIGVITGAWLSLFPSEAGPVRLLAYQPDSHPGRLIVAAPKLYAAIHRILEAEAFGGDLVRAYAEARDALALVDGEPPEGGG